MPIPLIKLGLVTVRTFARPFNSVLTRRILHQQSSREARFYHWFGMGVFRFEHKIDEMIQSQNAKGADIGLHVVPVQLSKVTDRAAINRGIEVFVELAVVYGVLFSVACVEMYRRSQEARRKKLQVEELEQRQSGLQLYMERLMEKTSKTGEPCAENHANLHRLEHRVARLEKQIAQIDKYLTQ